MQPGEPVDLVLRGGRVLDPAQGIDATMDVAIAGQRIAAVAPRVGPGTRELDVRGLLVLPGLIDLHAHVFWGIGHSPDADRDALAYGTTLIVDAGSAGCLTISGFRHHIAERSTIRVLSFLNLSSIGIIDPRIGELQNRTYLDEQAAIEAIQANRDLVRGLKVRLSEPAVGGFSRLVLEAGLRVAEQASVPLMAHISETSEPLSELLPLFRPGDVVTHALTGRREGLLDRQGRVLEAAREARARRALRRRLRRQAPQHPRGRAPLQPGLLVGLDVHGSERAHRGHTLAAHRDVPLALSGGKPARGGAIGYRGAGAGAGRADLGNAGPGQ